MNALVETAGREGGRTEAGDPSAHPAYDGSNSGTTKSSRDRLESLSRGGTLAGMVVAIAVAVLAPVWAIAWNNLAFPNVGMPHVLWELQGQRKATFETQKDAHDPSKVTQVFAGFEQISPGTMTPQQYDEAMADLVAYMQWMAEPARDQRVRIGVWVLLFLVVFTVIAWRLNAAYWKDIK